jgi:hypothetical protein
VHAARGHALVAGIDHHRDAARLQHLLQGVGDLRRHLLLDLQPLGIAVEQPRQLADPDHAMVRQIGDVRAADDRRQVMLAMALEAHVPEHDHLVVAVGLLESALEDRMRLLVVAAEELAPGAHHAVGRAEQAFARRVVAGPADQRTHRLLRLGDARALDARRGFRSARGGSLCARCAGAGLAGSRHCRRPCADQFSLTG